MYTPRVIDLKEFLDDPDVPYLKKKSVVRERCVDFNGELQPFSVLMKTWLSLEENIRCIKDHYTRMDYEEALEEMRIMFLCRLSDMSPTVCAVHFDALGELNNATVACIIMELKSSKQDQ